MMASSGRIPRLSLPCCCGRESWLRLQTALLDWMRWQSAVLEGEEDPATLRESGSAVFRPTICSSPRGNSDASPSSNAATVLVRQGIARCLGFCRGPRVGTFDGTKMMIELAVCVQPVWEDIPKVAPATSRASQAPQSHDLASLSRSTPNTSLSRPPSFNANYDCSHIVPLYDRTGGALGSGVNEAGPSR